MARRTLTIYLCKPDVQQFEDVFSDQASSRLQDGRTQAIEAPEFADGGRLFVFSSPTFTPAWLRELASQFAFDIDIRTSSACAVLVFRSNERLFISTFSHGWMMINEDQIEGDFGLRVALHGLNDEKLRRLERSNLADAMRGVSLSPFQREFESFGLDDALDLVRKVSGIANENSSADVLTGAKSIKLSGEFALSDLPALASECLAAFQSNSYQQTPFRVLDLVQPVVDRRRARLLDDQLCALIRDGSGRFELGLPDTQEVQTVGYRFVGPNRRGYHPDLQLDHYTRSLGDRLQELDIEMLRSHKIVSVHDEPHLSQKWSIRSALVGSMEHDGSLYAINEGEWYQLDSAFKQSIDLSFNEHRSEWTDQPVLPRRMLDEQGNARFESEADYNLQIAAQKGWLCLDRRLISVAGMARSEFEVCDLLDIDNKCLIHLKKSSRRSSVLSHFFKQGSNSAQQMIKFGGAWSALADMLEIQFGEEQKQSLLNANADNNRPWTVRFLIADVPRQDGQFNIPFFSKITMRDEFINLRAMGYRAELQFVRLARHHIATP